jgi:hypothetical protein
MGVQRVLIALLLLLGQAPAKPAFEVATISLGRLIRCRGALTNAVSALQSSESVRR